MIDEKLLEQLALAKEAGTKAMAKDFFAPTPGASPAEESAEGEMPPEGAEGGGSMAMQAEGDISPEQLEELMRMLESQGGGQP